MNRRTNRPRRGERARERERKNITFLIETPFIENHSQFIEQQTTCRKFLLTTCSNMRAWRISFHISFRLVVKFLSTFSTSFHFHTLAPPLSATFCAPHFRSIILNMVSSLSNSVSMHWCTRCESPAVSFDAKRLDLYAECDAYTCLELNAKSMCHYVFPFRSHFHYYYYCSCRWCCWCCSIKTTLFSLTLCVLCKFIVIFFLLRFRS